MEKTGMNQFKDISFEKQCLWLIVFHRIKNHLMNEHGCNYQVAARAGIRYANLIVS